MPTPLVIPICSPPLTLGCQYERDTESDLPLADRRDNGNNPGNSTWRLWCDDYQYDKQPVQQMLPSRLRR